MEFLDVTLACDDQRQVEAHKFDAGSFRLYLVKLEAAIGSVPKYRLTCDRQKP